MVFGPDQAVERIEKYEGRLLTVSRGEFALKLFDRKSKSIDSNTSFIGKLISDACVIGHGPSLPREPQNASPNAHDSIYDGFRELSKTNGDRPYADAVCRFSEAGA